MGGRGGQCWAEGECNPVKTWLLCPVMCGCVALLSALCYFLCALCSVLCSLPCAVICCVVPFSVLCCVVSYAGLCAMLFSYAVPVWCCPHLCTGSIGLCVPLCYALRWSVRCDMCCAPCSVRSASRCNVPYAVLCPFGAVLF